MNTEIQKQIDLLKKQVADLESTSIQLNIEPQTKLYLTTAVNEITATTIALQIASTIATLPTQTYSTSAPSGTAPTGSIWCYDTGVLATNEIHVYSGSGWVRMK